MGSGVGNKRGVQGLIFRGHFHTYKTTGHVKPYAYRINGVLSVHVMDTTYSHFYILSVLYGADLFPATTKMKNAVSAGS